MFGYYGPNYVPTDYIVGSHSPTWAIPDVGISLSTTVALTTVFTMPAVCSSNWHVVGDPPYTEIASDYSNGGYSNPVVSCFPSPFETEFYWFSPGVCPSYMDTVAIGTATFSGVALTQAACCQSGFTLETPETPPSSGYRYELSVCNSLFTTSTTIFEGSSSFVLPSGTAWHYPLGAAWQEKDISLFPSNVGPNTVSATTTSNSVPASTSNVASSPSASASNAHSIQSSNGSNNNKRSKIGMIVGPVVAAFIFICLYLFVLNTRRRRPAVPGISKASKAPSLVDLPEPVAEQATTQRHGHDSNRHPSIVELEAAYETHELADTTTEHVSGRQRHELGNATPSAELHGSIGYATEIMDTRRDESSKVIYANRISETTGSRNMVEGTLYELSGRNRQPEIDIELRILAQEEERIRARRSVLLRNRVEDS